MDDDPRSQAAGGLDPGDADPETRTIEAPAEIVCVDCGGACRLLTATETDDRAGPVGWFHPGDVVAYRCTECLDRWDIVLE